MIFDPAQLDNLKTFVNAPENPIIYLSIDPGKANGICGYDRKAYLAFMYTVNEDNVLDFLNQFQHVKKLIAENYLLYPNKAKQQTYSDMLTSRMIGRMESWCKDSKVDLIKQPASIKPTGYKWTGQKPPSKSDPANHEKDAHVHFVYWAVRNGVLDLSTLVKK